MGEEQLARHNFADAEAAFRIAVKADPENPALVIGLAGALLLAGDRVQAQSWYQKAVELAPGMAAAHNGVGLSAPSYDAAEAAFRMAIEFDPASELYKANLGWALYHLGLRSEAVETFMNLREADPDNLRISLALASILEEDGHVREAEFCLREVLANHDDDVDHDQAWYMYRLRQFDQADKLFMKVGYDVERAALYARHGRLALAAGLPGQAVASMKRAVSLSPRSARLHRDLSEAFTAAGDPFLADAARTRSGQMKRARRRSTDELATWAKTAKAV